MSDIEKLQAKVLDTISELALARARAKVKDSDDRPECNYRNAGIVDSDGDSVSLIYSSCMYVGDGFAYAVTMNLCSIVAMAFASNDLSYEDIVKAIDTSRKLLDSLKEDDKGKEAG